MERYLRAYRDPSSPLTPLTPFAENPTFLFNFDGDQTPQNSLSALKPSAHHAGTPLSSIEILNTKTELQTLHSRNQRRFSEQFNKLRNVFEPDQICTIQISNDDGDVIENVENLTPNIRENLPPLKSSKKKKNSLQNIQDRNTKIAQCNRFPLKNIQNNHIKNQMETSKKFIKVSPAGTKTLSPRTSALLAGSGLARYKSLFQREEIDLFVLRMLTFEELGNLGIEDMEERLQILAAAKMSNYIF